MIGSRPVRSSSNLDDVPLVEVNREIAQYHDGTARQHVRVATNNNSVVQLDRLEYPLRMRGRMHA